MRSILAGPSFQLPSRVRFIAGLLLAAGCLFSAPLPAAAQTPDPASLLPSADAGAANQAPTIAVQLGFGGVGKIGDWLPVTVQVANDGPSVTGELQIQVDDSADGTNRPLRGSFNSRPPTIYTVPASLPSHSRKQYQIDVFLPFPTKGLDVKLATSQGVLVQQTGQLQALSGSDVLCGTISQSQDFFQLLRNTDLPGRQGKKPMVVPLNPQDLPPRQHALSSLDCLIVDNVSMGSLTDDQKAALVGWVNDGGLLILGGGSGWQKTLQPLPKELLPVDVSGVRAIPSLQSLANFAAQPIQGDGPWLVAAGKPVNATVVAQDNGVPLLVGGRRGKGAVVYLALDPTTEPLSTWSGNAALWRYMLAYTSTPLAVYPFFNPFGGFSTIQNWGVPPRNAIYNISGVEPPSLRWLVIFVIGYAVALGPFSYLLMRLAGRRAIAWGTIPLLVAGGTYFTYNVVQQSQGSDLVLNTVSVVRSEDATPQVNVRSYVSLYTPREGDFALLAPGTASVTSYSRPLAPQSQPASALGPPNATQPWQLKVTESDLQNRVNLPLTASSTATLLIDGQSQLAGSVQPNLQVHGDTISGSLTNHTGESLAGVVLAIGADAHSVGTLGSGQTKPVSFTFNPNAPSTGPDAQHVKVALETDSHVADSVRANRESVLDALLGSVNGGDGAGLSGLTLLGWLNQTPMPLQIAGSHPSLSDTTLYVTSLPLQFPRGVDVLVPPALIGTKQIGTFSTNFQRAGQYELNSSGSLALEYTLPLQASDMASNDLVLHMQGHYANVGNQQRFAQPSPTGQSLGQIFLYNWQTSDWDARDFAWGDNVIKDSGPYVSATNTLRVRFTYKAPPQQANSTIQFTLDLTDQGQLK